MSKLRNLFANSPNLVGICCVIGAMISFTTQDSAIKWLSGSYPLHQIILTRASVALVLTLLIFVPLEGSYGHLRTRRLLLHVLRGLGIVVANFCFFTGLATLPLGEATAIFFVAPLLITVFSVLLLRERVAASRWGAVAIGLSGVIVVLRPGAEVFRWVSLLPVAAATAYALVQITTRLIGKQDKASTMAFYIQLTFVVVSGGIGLVFGDGRYANPDNPTVDFLFRAWTVPTVQDLWIMAGAGMLSGIGGYLVSQGYRQAEAGLVAPFEYVALPLSIFWSVFLFQDWPDLFAWCGIALITCAGIYSVYSESVKSRNRVLAPPPHRE